MLLLDQEGIIAPYVFHMIVQYKDGVPYIFPSRKGNFKIIFHVKKGKLTILGLSNMPKSGGWMSVTTIDIGLNNDFDNWFRASGVCISKTEVQRFWKTNQLKEPCFWKVICNHPLWPFILKWLNNILFNGDTKMPF